MNDAVFAGVETRTSPLVRIKRDSESLQSINTQGVIPAGEGAKVGVSATVKGIKVAEELALSMVAELE